MPGEITAGYRAFYYYGDKGSVLRNAGGLAGYAAKQRSKDETQRHKKLVEVFNFDGTGKYGCHHYYTPIEQVRDKFGKDKKLEGIDLNMMREITLRNGEVTNFEMW